MEFKLLLLSVTLYMIYLLSTFAFAKEIYPRKEVSFSARRAKLPSAVNKAVQTKKIALRQKSFSSASGMDIRTNVRNFQSTDVPYSESLKCTDIDIVYTWVNGTDPKFMHVFSKYRNINPRNMRRVRDYNTLQFSVRSVEKNAPWIRKIHIVTNGQVPTWLDTTNERIHLIEHSDLFKNATNLPVFNSNAIEASFPHFSDDVADCFIYLNDDFFIGEKAKKELFYKKDNIVVQMSRSKAPNFKKAKENLWHKSILNSNELLTRKEQQNFRKAFTHFYPSHVCYMMHKKVLRYLYNTFTTQFDDTAARKFRDGRDIALPFLNANTALTRFGATKDVNTKYFYMELSSNHTANVKGVEQMLRSKMEYCGCIQDTLDGTPTDDTEIRYLTESLCKLFPEPSSFEKPGYNVCLNYHKERTVITDK